MSDEGWKNSIRHNLSLKGSGFERTQYTLEGAHRGSCLWRMKDGFSDELTRKAYQRRSHKAITKTIPSKDSESPVTDNLITTPQMVKMEPSAPEVSIEGEEGYEESYEAYGDDAFDRISWSTENQLVHQNTRPADSSPARKFIRSKDLHFEELQDLMATKTSVGNLGFVCLLCGQSTTQKGCLKRHMREKHMEPSRFQCPACNKVFKNRAFEDHVMRVHPTWRGVDFNDFKIVLE